MPIFTENILETTVVYDEIDSSDGVRQMVEAVLRQRLAPLETQMLQWFETESKALSLANRRQQENLHVVDAQRTAGLETRLAEGIASLESSVNRAMQQVLVTAASSNDTVTVPKDENTELHSEVQQLRQELEVLRKQIDLNPETLHDDEQPQPWYKRIVQRTSEADRDNYANRSTNHNILRRGIEEVSTIHD